MFLLLRERTTRRVVIALAVTGTGSWAALVGLWGHASYEFHSVPLGIAALVVAWSAPATLLGAVPGIMLRRFGTRQTFVTGQIIGALSSVGLATSSSWTQLIIYAVLLGCARALALPAADSLPPLLAPKSDLLKANALIGVASDFAMVTGPLLAALVLVVATPRTLFLLDAFTYLLAAGLVAAERSWPSATLDEPLPSKVEVARETSRATARIVLTLMLLVYLSWAVFLVLEPIYVRDVLKRSPAVFAALQTTYAVAVVSASFLVARFNGPRPRLLVLSVAVALSGLACGMYVGTSLLPVAIGAIAFWGATNAFATITARTVIHRELTPAQQPRVLALNRALQAAPNVILVPVFGLLADDIGVQRVGLLTAGVITVWACFSMGGARRLDSDVRARASMAESTEVGDEVTMPGEDVSGDSGRPLDVDRSSA